ncbi:MAG: nucleotidyltransferase domain-containing protein [Sedimentisphaerales bacterium]
MVSSNDINSFCRRIADTYDTEKIILFGSYAKDTATKDSDVDMLVVADIDLPPAKRYSAIRKLADGIDAAFDLVVRTPDEYNHWKSVLNNIVYFADKYGKVVYDRSTKR